ncbi:hypothetical protein SLS57_006113 [Botryosphaeria dothidea]
MPSQSASIQSYFSPQPSPVKSRPSTQAASSSSSSHTATHSDATEATDMSDNVFIPGDGFTADEMASSPEALPLTGPFTPPHGIPYKEVKLSPLGPTDQSVTFIGRIVNIYAPKLQRAPKSAKGCLRCTVSDGEDLVTDCHLTHSHVQIRLWHGNVTYPLRIGSLITVWTTHITLSEHESISPSSVPLYTSIFPERDRNCHLQIHEDTPENDLRCRKPLNSSDGDIQGLMTLSSFAAGGWEVPNAKVLVCVKSVGARKTITRPDTTTSSTATTIHLLDHTTTTATPTTITLWDASSTSAADWKPNTTTLLLTAPGFRTPTAGGPVWLSVTANTRIEVDPAGRDAAWLRGYAARLLRKQHVCPSVPANAFPEVDEIESARTRILFTLAELDEFARAAVVQGGRGRGEVAGATKAVVGWVSVVVTEETDLGSSPIGVGLQTQIIQGYTGPQSSIPVPSIHDQVSGFLENPSDDIQTTNPLFVLFGGANDVFFNPNITAAQSFNEILASRSALSARFPNATFLVLDYPDLGRIPYAYYINRTDKYVLHAFSQGLSSLLGDLSSHYRSVATPQTVFVELPQLFDQWDYYADPLEYGFDPLGAYGSCLVGVYEETETVSLCSDPNSKVFWDEYQ